MAVARVGHDERHSRRSVVNDMSSSEDIFSPYCLIKVCDVILIIAHGTELLPYLCLKKAGNFLYAHTRMQSDQTFPDNSVPV